MRVSEITHEEEIFHTAVEKSGVHVQSQNSIQ